MVKRNRKVAKTRRPPNIHHVDPEARKKISIIPFLIFKVLEDYIRDERKTSRHLCLAIKDFDMKSVNERLITDTNRHLPEVMFFCIKFIDSDTCFPLGAIRFSKLHFEHHAFSLAKAVKAFISDLQLLRLKVIMSVSEPAPVYRELLKYLIPNPEFTQSSQPMVYPTKAGEVVHVYDLFGLMKNFQASFYALNELNFLAYNEDWGLKWFKSPFSDFISFMKQAQYMCTYVSTPRSPASAVFVLSFFYMYKRYMKEGRITPTPTTSATTYIIELLCPLAEVFYGLDVLTPSDLEAFYDSTEKVRLILATAKFKRRSRPDMLEIEPEESAAEVYEAAYNEFVDRRSYWNTRVPSTDCGNAMKAKIAYICKLYLDNIRVEFERKIKRLKKKGKKSKGPSSSKIQKIVDGAGNTVAILEDGELRETYIGASSPREVCVIEVIDPPAGFEQMLKSQQEPIPDNQSQSSPKRIQSSIISESQSSDEEPSITTIITVKQTETAQQPISERLSETEDSPGGQETTSETKLEGAQDPDDSIYSCTSEFVSSASEAECDPYNIDPRFTERDDTTERPVSPSILRMEKLRRAFEKISKKHLKTGTDDDDDDDDDDDEDDDKSGVDQGGGDQDGGNQGGGDQGGSDQGGGVQSSDDQGSDDQGGGDQGADEKGGENRGKDGHDADDDGDDDDDRTSQKRTHSTCSSSDEGQFRTNFLLFKDPRVTPYVVSVEVTKPEPENRKSVMVAIPSLKTQIVHWTGDAEEEAPDPSKSVDRECNLKIEIKDSTRNEVLEMYVDLPSFKIIKTEIKGAQYESGGTESGSTPSQFSETETTEAKKPIKTEPEPVPEPSQQEQPDESQLSLLEQCKNKIKQAAQLAKKARSGTQSESERMEVEIEAIPLPEKPVEVPSTSAQPEPPPEKVKLKTRKQKKKTTSQQTEQELFGGSDDSDLLSISEDPENRLYEIIHSQPEPSSSTSPSASPTSVPSTSQEGHVSPEYDTSDDLRDIELKRIAREKCYKNKENVIELLRELPQDVITHHSSTELLSTLKGMVRIAFTMRKLGLENINTDSFSTDFADYSVHMYKVQSKIKSTWPPKKTYTALAHKAITNIFKVNWRG